MVAQRVIDELGVVIPTLGRPLLEGCLESLARGDALPARLVVVDQGRSPDARRWAERLRERGVEVTYVPSEERGTAAGTNRGVELVGTRLVAVTHDDCLVAHDWVSRMHNDLLGHPGCIITGRIEGEGEGTMGLSLGRDVVVYRRPPLQFDPLFPGNMAFPMALYDEVGPFDEHPLVRVAEDAEWCYRALRSGVPIVYTPQPVVRHVGWRDPEAQLAAHHGYARSQGAFYGRHTRRGDRFVLVRLGHDLARALWMVIRGGIRGEPTSLRVGQTYMRGLPAGFIGGWRSERPMARLR